MNNNEIEQWVNVGQDLDVTKIVTDAEIIEMVAQMRERSTTDDRV